ncbi:MAG: helix-turn-helix transcriptional regulator [Pseudomonadota bacterium]
MDILKKAADISDDLIVERKGNGIILKPPCADDENKLTMRDLLALPMNVYCLNQNSNICSINSIAAETTGFGSQRMAIDKSLSDIWPHHQAAMLMENDKGVFKSNKMKVFEEDIFNEKVFGLQALSFKFPWYDKNRIVGIVGFSMIPDCYPFYSLGNALAILAKTQLLSSPSSDFAGNLLPLPTENYFTRRERDVLKLLVRAKTSKEIATQLGLSHRTVEHYIENAKRKVGASSKSDLIDKIINIF